VAAGQKRFLQGEKPYRYPTERDHQTALEKRNGVGLRLRSGYALPTSQANAILILIVATLSP
jgi:hypothetical protein